MSEAPGQPRDDMPADLELAPQVRAVLAALTAERDAAPSRGRRPAPSAWPRPSGWPTAIP